MRSPSLAFASVSFVALAFGSVSPAFAQTPQEPTAESTQAPATTDDCAALPEGEQRDACAAAAVTGTPAQAPATGASSNGAGESVVVTGSRIRRDEFNTGDSVQVLTRKESTQAGFTSTAEVLQSTAVTGGTSQINNSYGGFVVDGGPGVNTVSLRGLGTTRTLVLLDGRRVSPAGSRGSVGAADLNVLPNALIDRVEILNTGASSIYGSDAVAGVVNIVTRKKMNGLQLEMQQSVPEVGTGVTSRYSLVGGVDTGPLNIIGSLEYYHRGSMAIGDRSFSSCPTTLYGTNGSDFGADDFVDPRTGQVRCFPLENGGVTVNTIGTRNFNVSPTSSLIAFAPGVLDLAPTGTGIVQCNRFRPNAAVTTGSLPGYECVGGSYYTAAGKFLSGINTNIRDTVSKDALNSDLISGADIYTGYLSGTYDLDVLGGAQVYASFLGTRRDSSQKDTRQFSIDYLPGSPLIPASLNAGSGLSSAIGIRAFTDYGLYDNRQTNDFFRLNGGITGKLPHDWRYDLFAGHSWSNSKYTTDLILTDRLNKSLDVVSNGAGGFVCRDPSGGCVAAPALTPDVVGGNYIGTPWFDYITSPVTGTTIYKESTAALNLDGPIFKLPGGDLKGALGLEYRKASINDTPDINSQNGNLFGFTSSTITKGSDSVWEAFGELEAPILRDQFIHQLTLNGSARYTRYKSYGGDWTYKFGALLSPIRELTFRGSYGTSYRAPALYEQFMGATSGFLANTTDPCNDLSSVTNPLVLERCTAEGLAPDFRQTNSVTVIGLGGAEAGLKAETSKALTYGAVFQPRLGDWGRLSLSADYFDVKVANGVSRLSASQVLGQCYTNPERTLCDTPFITRDPTTNALTVIQSFINISDAEVAGIDFNARLTANFGPGKLTLGAAVTRFSKRYDRTLPDEDILNEIGLLLNPKWTGTFDANYETGPWTFHWGTEWVGKTSSKDYAEPFGYDPNVYQFETPNYFLHNASVSFEAKQGWGLTLGVRNIFDKNPPTISADYTDQIGNAPLYSAYDYRGRTFFLNVSASLNKLGDSLGL